MQTAYEMPGLDGIEVAAALRNAVPGVRILMVTTFRAAWGYLRRAVEAAGGEATRRRLSWLTPSGGFTRACAWSTRRWPRRRWSPGPVG